MKNTSRLSIGCVLSVAVVILLAVAVNGYLAARAEWRLRSQLAAIRAAGDPASIADLATRAIPDDENAAAILQQIKPRLAAFSKAYGAFYDTPVGKKYDAGLERGEPATKEQIDAIRAILDEFGDVEAAVNDASNCDAYASQLDFTMDQPTLIAALLPAIQNSRSAARLLAWRNEVLLADGKYDEAVENGIETLRLARLCDEEPTLVSYLVSIAIRGIAANALYDDLASGKVSPKAHAALERELALQDDPNRLVRALKTERAVAADWINAQASGRSALLVHFFGWKLKSLQSEVIDSMNTSVQVADQPWYLVKPALKQIDANAQLNASAALASQMMPAVDAALEANARCLAQLRALRIDNALCAYSETTGHDASGLSDLTLSKAATVDPYSGQPLKLKHTAEGWIVYSVMRNGTDEGGDFIDLQDFGVAPAKYRVTQKPEQTANEDGTPSN